MWHRQISKLSLCVALLLFWILYSGFDNMTYSEKNMAMNKQMIIKQLRGHLTMLTHTIGERSVRRTDNLEKAATYIQDQFENFGFDVQMQQYSYTCSEPGCQHYPFPLQFLGYPKEGNFIGIVGNVNSLRLTRRLRKSFQHNPNLPVVSLTVPLNGWIMPAVRLSDHASFWTQGYRAVMLTDSAFFRNPHYHLPSDTM